LFAIAYSYFLAVIAGFGSVIRRYKVNGYTFPFGFVADKALQLIERPTVMQATLRFTKTFVRTRTNTFQIFNSNGFSFSLCFSYNGFGNGVILNLYRSTLLPTKPFQNSFRIFCAFGLQRTTHFLSMLTKSIQFFATKYLYILRYDIIDSSNIGDSQIYTNTIIKFLLLFMRNI